MNSLKRNNEDEEDDEIKKEDKYTHEYYIKLLHKNRTILLYDEINNITAEIICSQIKGMNLLDDKKPITIEINSPGGNINDGLAILDCIQASKAPIYTIVTGEAASMGGILSVAGTKRFITKNAVWMMHSSAAAIGDYIQHVQDRTTFILKLEQKMNTLLKKKTKLNMHQMRQIKNGELWLFAEEARQYGIVDKII